MNEIQNNTYEDIIADKKISETEFNNFIEAKFNGLNETQKTQLENKYINLKDKFKEAGEQIVNFTQDDLSLLHFLFLPEHKEEVTELGKLADYFNIKDKSKLDELAGKLLKAGLQPAIFLNKYKNIIEKKLSGLESIPNGDKYLEKIKLSIGKTFLNIGKEINILEKDIKGLNNGKNVYNYKWDIQEKIDESFNFINTSLIPSTEILIKEGGKINGTTSYFSYIFSNGNKKGNEHIDFYKKIEGIIESLESDVLDDGTFSESLDTFDTDGIIGGSTDKATLGFKGIEEIEEVSILSDKEKQLQAKAESAKIGIILAMLVPVAGDIASLASDWRDLIGDEDGITEYGKTLGLIPKEYNKLNTKLDRTLGGVGVIASLITSTGIGIGLGTGIKSIIKGREMTKILSKLKKLGVRNPEKIIEDSYNNAKKVIGKGKNKEKTHKKVENTRPDINMVKRNTKLKPQERLDKASQLLQKNFSSEQEKAILNAYNIGKENRESGIYNYTPTEIRQKYKILKNAGLKKDEIKILMDNGIVGKINKKLELKENLTTLFEGMDNTIKSRILELENNGVNNEDDLYEFLEKKLTTDFGKEIDDIEPRFFDIYLNRYEGIVENKTKYLETIEKLKKIESNFIKKVLNGVEKLIRKNKNNVLLFDIDETIVKQFEGTDYLRPSLKILLQLLKSKYPDLEFGILTARGNAYNVGNLFDQKYIFSSRKDTIPIDKNIIMEGLTKKDGNNYILVDDSIDNSFSNGISLQSEGDIHYQVFGGMASHFGEELTRK